MESFYYKAQQRLKEIYILFEIVVFTKHMFQLQNFKTKRKYSNNITDWTKLHKDEKE